jgi:hypothetical protein
MAVLCGFVWGYTIFKILHMENPRNLTGILPQGPRNTKASPKAGVLQMARWTGLEPATPGVTGRYSNQLSYHRAIAG